MEPTLQPRSHRTDPSQHPSATSSNGRTAIADADARSHESSNRDRASALGPAAIIAAGVAFAGIASFFAPERAWMEAVSESFVPYGAVPLAAGWGAHHFRGALVAPIGAAASIAMVVAFYTARPALGLGYGIIWSDLIYWSLIGAASGALLARSASLLRTRARRQGVWALAGWLTLALLPVAYFAATGWGRIDVAASSGIVTIGYSTADVILAATVMAAFHGALILAANRDPTARPHGCNR